MSEMAKSAREKLKSKAERMVKGDPTSKIDASDFVPPSQMENDVQTGPRVLTKRPTFKRGGSIVPHGTYTSLRADRKRRASGGMTADEYQNRDMKKANESREGRKHDGGMAHGGSCGCSMCSGGRAKKKGGGKVGDMGGERPTGGRIAKASGGSALADRMNAQILPTMSERATLPSRKKKASGTNITIVIPQAKQQAPMPMARPPMAPPPGGPIGLHQGTPPMPPPGAMPPQGMPPGGAPPAPMMRKAGGRAYPLKDGGGGAKGRLQKIKSYGATPQ